MARFCVLADVLLFFLATWMSWSCQNICDQALCASQQQEDLASSAAVTFRCALR